MSPPLRTAVGVLGGLIFATAGAIIGSQNAGWFGLERNANDVLPVCGIGAGLVALAFARGSFSTAVAQVGKVGKTARVLIVVGCVTYILSALAHKFGNVFFDSPPHAAARMSSFSASRAMSRARSLRVNFHSKAVAIP